MKIIKWYHEAMHWLKWLASKLFMVLGGLLAAQVIFYQSIGNNTGVLVSAAFMLLMFLIYFAMDTNVIVNKIQRRLLNERNIQEKR